MRTCPPPARRMQSVYIGRSHSECAVAARRLAWFARSPFLPCPPSLSRTVLRSTPCRDCRPVPAFGTTTALPFQDDRVQVPAPHRRRWLPGRHGGRHPQTQPHPHLQGGFVKRHTTICREIHMDCRVQTSKNCIIADSVVLNCFTDAVVT